MKNLILIIVGNRYLDVNDICKQRVTKIGLERAQLDLQNLNTLWLKTMIVTNK